MRIPSHRNRPKWPMANRKCSRLRRPVPRTTTSPLDRFEARTDSARAMAIAFSPQRNPPCPVPWHEVLGGDGAVRPLYGALLENLGRLRPLDLRALDDRMAATLREMGVNFDVLRSDPWGRQPWTCDLLPHIFASEDWALLVAGFQQRLRAFEYFLADIYGEHDRGQATFPDRPWS